LGTRCVSLRKALTLFVGFNLFYLLALRFLYPVLR